MKVCLGSSGQIVVGAVATLSVPFVIVVCIVVSLSVVVSEISVAKSQAAEAIVLDWRADLQFGTLIPFGPAAVRVVPNPGCHRIIEYGELVHMGPCGPARLHVAGEPNRAYTVTIPASALQMPKFGHWWEGGAGPVATAFAVTSPNGFILDGTGEDIVLVGGTLQLDGSDGDDVYFGVLEVVVEYE